MPNSKVRILSLDGGGIRGVIPATIMVEIEQRLQQRTQNPNARIADFVDLVAGTSTGGILTGIYLLPVSLKDDSATLNRRLKHKQINKDKLL